jgi:small-conductance mechanosensitive channel
MLGKLIFSLSFLDTTHLGDRLAMGLGFSHIPIQRDKETTEQVVGGLVVKGCDVFEEGEDILAGDGTEGCVIRIGLIETEIHGYDNIVSTIPNSKLVNQKASNLSRVQRSQAKQTLRFQCMS